jgi:hypothetical protein
VTADAPPPSQDFDWEAAGRTLSPGVDRLSAIAVLGSDMAHTASVALGIARTQARRRRVAIGNLLGDAAPLQALVPSDDPHGLADVFEYGVSISKVAYQVEGESQLFVMPSGVFVSDEAAIMSNRRWSRLANGFREEKALLIVAASAEAADVEALVLQLDGAVIVGGRAPALLPVSRVLATIRPDAPVVIERRAAPQTAPRGKRYVVRGRGSWWRVGATIGLALTAVFVAIGFWLASRPFADSEWAPVWLRGKAPVAFTGLGGAADSARMADSISQIEKAMGLFTAEDSASVAPFALSLVTHNTQAGALLELRRNGATLPAGTFTPVLIRETPWFRVVAGAYPDSVAAAALLDTLRARGMSDAGRVVIERYPYALLVERDVPDSAVGTRVARYQARGLPVYALLQSNGTARLYAGAFKAPDEANLLTDAMRAAGLATSVVFRTGRVY